MKKNALFILVMMMLFLVACSNQGAGDVSTESTQMNSETAVGDVDVRQGEMDFAEEMEEAEFEESSSDVDSEDATQIDDVNENRKVIYTADLQVETKSYSKLADSIQAETAKLGGYVVESNMYSDSGEDFTSGQIIVRVPQKSFDNLISIVESGSSKVIEHYVSGQDVTEEFVDLESRLKSKRVVEERLLDFMGNAEKTEDLLAISDNLSNVQEEIETIVGRVNYLQDKTDLATVTISIHENNVTLSGINDDELNTWEETKKQFMRSVNFIITSFSSIFVFIGGNFPLLLLLVLFALTGYLVIRKKIKARTNKESAKPKEEKND